MSVPTKYTPSLKDIVLSVMGDRSCVHVPHLFAWKPASVGSIVIIAGSSVDSNYCWILCILIGKNVLELRGRLLPGLLLSSSGLGCRCRASFTSASSTSTRPCQNDEHYDDGDHDTSGAHATPSSRLLRWWRSRWRGNLRRTRCAYAPRFRSCRRRSSWFLWIRSLRGSAARTEIRCLANCCAAVLAKAPAF
jgi:hypothetical protein